MVLDSSLAKEAAAQRRCRVGTTALPILQRPFATPPKAQ